MEQNKLFVYFYQAGAANLGNCHGGWGGGGGGVCGADLAISDFYPPKHKNVRTIKLQHGQLDSFEIQMINKITVAFASLLSIYAISALLSACKMNV